MFSAFTDARKRMIGSPKKKRQHKHSPKYNDAIRKYKKSREAHSHHSPLKKGRTPK